jgi:hypothetical protein
MIESQDTPALNRQLRAAGLPEIEIKELKKNPDSHTKDEA